MGWIFLRKMNRKNWINGKWENRGKKMGNCAIKRKIGRSLMGSLSTLIIYLILFSYLGSSLFDLILFSSLRSIKWLYLFSIVLIFFYSSHHLVSSFFCSFFIFISIFFFWFCSILDRNYFIRIDFSHFLFLFCEAWMHICGGRCEISYLLISFLSFSA